jgi:hypothetical protein
MMKNFFYLGICGILVLGCGDSNDPTLTAPTTGTLAVNVSTESAEANLDPDGYFLIIDERNGMLVEVNTTLSVAALPTGIHQARLEGLTDKCTVTGLNPRPVYVGTNASPSLPVHFVVSCGDEPVVVDGDY